MQIQTSLNTLSFQSEKLKTLVADVEDRFPWQPVHPKEPIESIMYRAGQASVVEYIKTYLDDN